MVPVPGRPAPSLVSAMFGRIAGRYDLLNGLMTAGRDKGWRRAAVREAAPASDGLALDVGTGTARLAAALATAMPSGWVIGVDFAEPMLRAGQLWLWRQEAGERVALVAGDALKLPFPDGRFDCLTSAFTVRNLSDLELGFREQARVVKGGGRVVCLELTWPANPVLAALFPWYFGRLVPLLGRLISGDDAAYSYLPASVRAFPQPSAIAELMERAGLVEVRWRRLGLGAVTLLAGLRPG